MLVWEIIWSAAAVMGGLAAWKAFKHRDLDRMPPGVEEGTPVGEWPEPLRREAINYQIARHWKTYLSGGIALVMIGAAGTFLLSWNQVEQADSPTREDIIDAMAANPQSTYSREEAACAFDAMEAAGVDVIALFRLPEDEMLSAFGSASGQMTESEAAQIEACLDDETRARATARADTMTDEQLRNLLINAMVADQSADLDRSEAACLLDVLEDRGLVRELARSDNQLSPELETALIEAETACL